MIVDTHVHVSSRWFEPIETLITLMDMNDVDRAVLVQDVSELNDAYLLSCVSRFPDRVRAIAAVTSATPFDVQRVQRLAEAGIVGLRLHQTFAQGELEAAWEVAAALRLAISCRGTSDGYRSPQFRATVAALRDVPVVLEHLGDTNKPSGDNSASRDPVWNLAPFQNVRLKVPGLGELVPRDIVSVGPSDATPVPNVLRAAYEAFGADRLMWGSDFPLVCGREGYANALQRARGCVASLDGQAVSKVFGDNGTMTFWQ